MICNVGGVDRIVRVLVGIVLTAGAIVLNPSLTTKVSLLVVATASLATAWFGFCFINKMLGINTAHPSAVLHK